MLERFAEPLVMLKNYVYDGFEPRYNVAPNSAVWAILPENELRPLQWGLIPEWVVDLNNVSNLTSCRDDALIGRKEFQDNYRNKRCLIPVSGFYQWKEEGGSEVPFFFYNDEKEDFCIAALWDQWREFDLYLDTFAIITTDANELMTSYNSRMPVIIQKKDYDRWLNPGNVDDLLKPAAENFLICHQVSSYVNEPGNEGVKCIEAI